jgi:hypothetical protein
MEEKRLELERAVTIGGRVLFPIAWTVGRPAIGRHSLRVAMVREAFGVIVRDDEGVRVFLTDGRTVSVDELVDTCPSLAAVLDSLRPVD